MNRRLWPITVTWYKSHNALVTQGQERFISIHEASLFLFRTKWDHAEVQAWGNDSLGDRVRTTDGLATEIPYIDGGTLASLMDALGAETSPQRRARWRSHYLGDRSQPFLPGSKGPEGICTLFRITLRQNHLAWTGDGNATFKCAIDRSPERQRSIVE